MKYDYRVIAVKNITNIFSIRILENEYGNNDFVRVADCNYAVYGRICKCKIYFDKTGRPYFNHYKQKHYLDEFIKTR